MAQRMTCGIKPHSGWATKHNYRMPPECQAEIPMA
jgi:hypothetical protein